MFCVINLRQNYFMTFFSLFFNFKYFCVAFSFSSVPKLLVDLHVKLLRKIGKSVSADRWEKYLVKVCFCTSLFLFFGFGLFYLLQYSGIFVVTS